MLAALPIFGEQAGAAQDRLDAGDDAPAVALQAVEGADLVLVATPVGRVCLALGIGLDALGALWMRRIVRSTP